VSTYSVHVTSSYPGVADISNAGIITLGGATGTAILTASFAETDTYDALTATCTIVVTDPNAPEIPSGGGYFEKVTSAAGLVNGKYLIVYEEGSVAFDGNLETLDAASNNISVIIDSNKIEATDDNKNACFTLTSIGNNAWNIKSNSGLYIGRTGTNNGLDTSETATDDFKNFIEFSDEQATIKNNSESHTLQYNAASDQNRFRFFTSTTQKAIALYKLVESSTDVTTIPVQISAAGLATFACDFALDFTTVSNEVKAYMASVSGETVSLTEVTQVPANTGVLVRSMSGSAVTANVPVATGTVAELSDNAFIRGTGAAVASTVGQNYNYILNVVNNTLGFYAANNQIVGVNRAYLQTTTSAARISLIFDEATGITSLQQSQKNGEVYNLNGQRVDSPRKGLYIVNGKKVAIK